MGHTIDTEGRLSELESRLLIFLVISLEARQGCGSDPNLLLRISPHPSILPEGVA